VITFGANLRGRDKLSVNMNRVYFLIAILIILFMKCLNSMANDSGKQNLIAYVNAGDTNLPDTSNNSETGNDDCVRSIPIPIIDKTKFPNEEFTLEDRIGYETVRFNNGDILKIRNEGCESYSISFCFETSELMADSTNIKKTCEAFIQLLGKIKDAQNSVIDLNKTISILKTYKRTPGAKLYSEIIIDDAEIGESAWIVQVRKVSQKKSVFEIEISIGPL